MSGYRHNIYYTDKDGKQQFAFSWLGNPESGIERAWKDAKIHNIEMQSVMALPVAAHYIGSVDIRYGEYQFDESFLFTTTEHPVDYLVKHASHYYGDEEGEIEDDSGAFYYNAGEICVTPGKWEELSPHTYDSLKNVLTEL